MIALVVGASSGFGLEIANELSRLKWDVYATLRKPSGGLEPAINVICPFDVRTFVADELPNVDACVISAGYALWGPLEFLSAAEVSDQFEVNVFGALRVVQRVLGYMRERRSGRIVLIGSTADAHLRFGGGTYAASKAALRVIARQLELETRQFGVRVLLIEPDACATRYAQNRVISSGVKRAQAAGYEFNVPPSKRDDELDPLVVVSACIEFLTSS